MRKSDDKILYELLDSRGFTPGEIAETISHLKQDGSACLDVEECDSGDRIRHGNGGNHHDRVWLRLLRIGEQLMIVMEETDTRSFENDTESHELFVLTPNNKVVIVWGWRERTLDQSKAQVLASFRDGEAEVLTGGHLLGNLADIPEDWWHSSESANEPGSGAEYEQTYDGGEGGLDLGEATLAKLCERERSAKRLRNELR